MKVIGVRFKSTKKIYYFNPNGFEINKYDNVIVETARGIEFGQTVIGIRDVDENDIVQPLQNVIRIATEQDEKNVAENIEKQKDAFEKCRKKIEEHGLDMKLVDAEYTFDGTKLIFYFTSDGRVDFRELVKDLALMFRTRIELRQIAVRDETKMLGGLGACGNEICCKRFLGDFASVSIKMAKEQNLSLNPTKISGLCGRLICCLNYEKSFYDEMNQKLPAVDENVMSPKGNAQVVATYPLKESVRVKYSNADGSTDTAVFPLNEITRINGNTKKEPDDVTEEDILIEDSVLNQLDENTVTESAKKERIVKADEKELNADKPNNEANKKDRNGKNQRHNYPKKDKNVSDAVNAEPKAGSSDKNNRPNGKKHKKHDSEKTAADGNNRKQPRDHEENNKNNNKEKNTNPKEGNKQNNVKPAQRRKSNGGKKTNFSDNTTKNANSKPEKTSDGNS